MPDGLEARRHAIQQPSVAEIVANVLRERIVSGELSEGESLPKQEEMLREFNVSRQSLRESLRLLETEGLISIRRGNVGGAVVHVPNARHATYLLGLVLQSERVAISDLSAAIRHAEPLCAALCAMRDDRETAVVPVLEKLVDRAEGLIDEPEAFTIESRVFHTELIHLSGNRTLELVLGVLDELWSAQESRWALQAVQEDEYPSRERRLDSVKSHRRIVRLIRDGEPDKVTKALERHVAAVQHYVMQDRGSVHVKVTSDRERPSYL